MKKAYDNYYMINEVIRVILQSSQQNFRTLISFQKRLPFGKVRERIKYRRQ